MARLGAASPYVLGRRYVVVLALLAFSTGAFENILTHDQLSHLVKATDTLPVVVYYHGPRCGTCKTIGAKITDLASIYEGSVVFAQVDIEKNLETARAEGVMSVPNLHVFQQGEFVEEIISKDDRSSSQFLPSLQVLLQGLAPHVGEDSEDDPSPEQEAAVSPSMQAI